MNQAVLYIIFATFLYSLMNVGVKWLDHLPATEIVFFRGLITLGYSLFFILRKGESLWGNNRRLLILRGVFGTLALVSLFYLLQKIPLAVAIGLFNLTPIITVFIAHFYLKEPARPSQWVFLVISFIAVILIRGGIEPIPVAWLLLGVLTAVFAAIAYTQVRMLRTSEDPLVVIFYFPLITIPMIGPIAAYQWVPPQSWDWVLLFLLGTLVQVAQYFMTVAYQTESAAKIMVFNYLGIVWALLFGYGLFNEILTLRQICGIMLIFSCLIGNYWVSRLEKAKNQYA